MKRLTRKKIGNTDGKEFVLCNPGKKDCDDSCQYGTCEWSRKALLKLKEYEDLEEQGLLLRLPRKEGDTVYIIGIDFAEYLNGVKKWSVFKKKFSLRHLDYIGKTVFLTKAEAEEALKRMEREE